jgi:ABC-2 type transport system ATP-binding protein
VIAIEHLTKDYGRVRAVDDLSFGVGQGRIVGFLGPNGSGKTTTLRALLGLVRATSGSALIDGRPYNELTDPLRRVGAMLDAVAHPSLTARRHLRVLAAEAGASRARVEELLELVELAPAAGRRIGGYSLGMRQRLGLAGALVGDPEVLVLDEPANGLDPEGIHWLRDFLRALAGEGRTVLLSSHVLSEVAQTADSVVVIAGGRLLADATVAELTRTDTATVRVRTEQPITLAAALRAEGHRVTHGDDDLIVTGTDQESVALVAFDQRIVVYGLTTESSTLEDVYLQLTTPEGSAAGTRPSSGSRPHGRGRPARSPVRPRPVSGRPAS